MPLIARFAILFAAAAVAASSIAGLGDRSCARYPDGAYLSIAGTLETRPDDAIRTVQLRADGSGACRIVRVRMPDDAPHFIVGDAVRASGTWMVQRIEGDAAGSGSGLLIADHVSRATLPARVLLRARGSVQERLRALFPAAYPLAEALLIAQRESIAPAVKENFAAAGLTHLLAISGTHVALVAAVIVLIVRLLRFSVTTASAVSIAGSAGYVLFLGAPFAAVRALIQMVLLLASRLLQRPAHPLGLLGAAAIVITAIDPNAPLDAGFQLSFAGIIGIILWRRPLIDAMPKSVPHALRDALATTLAATLITTPIAAYQFGIVSVVAVVANLFAGPVVSLAVPLSAAALALSFVNMAAARFVAGGAELTLLWLNRIAQSSAALPLGHFFVPPDTVAFTTGAALLAYAAARGSYRSSRNGRVALASGVALLPLVVGPMLSGNGNLQIHMIDVGQGDAFAIRTPHGRWLLVDAGPQSERFDAGKARVVPFLLAHQADALDAVILSHPHLDHFGGLRSIMDRVHVDAVIDPDMPVASPPFDSLLIVAQRKHIRWLKARPGSVITVDGVQVDFLMPDSVSLDPAADPNDFSAAFLLRYGAFSALFLGDLYTREEAELVARYGRKLDVDLLKVAHHGSSSSTSDAVLEASTPAIALVSVGRRNHYGHPDPRTIARLKALGSHVFRSDQDGSVTVSVAPNGSMKVRTAQ